MTKNAQPIERRLPSNIQAECAVLGSLLIDPQVLSGVAEIVLAEDFYRDAHRSIYLAILSLDGSQKEADFLTVTDLLEQQGKLEAVGGASYLASLVNEVPTSGNARYYAQIVQRTAIQRRLIHVASQIVADAYQEVEEVADLVEQAERRIFEIGQRSALLGVDTSMRELVRRYFEELDERYQQRGRLVGVPSGFLDLDHLTGGFHTSDLIVVAGRPGTGKTAFLLSMAYEMAVRFGRKVGIFSLEMSPTQLAERLVARASGVPTNRLRRGLIEDDEWEPIVAALDHLLVVSMQIDGTAMLSPLQLRARARRWVVEEGIEILFVDYLQLMQPDGTERRKPENRVQIIDEISRTMKLLARELNLPVVMLAQLSRAVEQRPSKVPQLSDLRESGSIEMNADLVLLLYREEIYQPETERKHQVDIIVAKQRNGPLGQVTVAFDPLTTSFRELQEAQLEQWEQQARHTVEGEDEKSM